MHGDIQIVLGLCLCHALLILYLLFPHAKKKWLWGAGIRKIVLATNIAETSITVADCTWVVDTGRLKEQRYCAETHMQALAEGWASRASVRQRRGRAGRTAPGTCLRLFSRCGVHSLCPVQQAWTARMALIRSYLQAMCSGPSLTLQ